MKSRHEVRSVKVVDSLSVPYYYNYYYHDSGVDGSGFPRTLSLTCTGSNPVYTSFFYWTIISGTTGFLSKRVLELKCSGDLFGSLGPNNLKSWWKI